MSAPSQSYPQSYPRTAFARLTITEVEIEPSPVLGKSRIYLYAAAGTVFGVLLGVAVASSPSPGWMGRSGASNAGILTLDRDLRGKQSTRGETAVVARGPKDLGSIDAIAAGLKGHLTANWQDGPAYHLTLEPADASMRPGFSMAVTSSPRPLSVGFELLDSAGSVLCGQNVIVRFNAARTNPGSASAAVEQLEARELNREHGRDIFENVIGEDGKIAAIDAQGKMPCTQQAYESATSWSLSADFPSIAEQAGLLKLQTETAATQEPSSAHKPRSDKSIRGRS